MSATHGNGHHGGTTEAADLSFEEAFARLEATVARLEAGSLTVDEMVGEFERGMALARICNQCLDTAELRITRLLRGDDGEVRRADLLGGDE